MNGSDRPKIPPIVQDAARLMQLREELDRMQSLPEIHVYRFVRTLIDVALDHEKRILRIEESDGFERRKKK